MQLWLEKLPDGQTGDWVLIEMQGELESRVGDDQMCDKFIGDLHYAKGGLSGSTVPTLIIGHHILHGKVVPLDRPMVVMEKSECDEAAMDTDQSRKSDDKHFIIKAIIKKKLLFKTRPKPIIANVPKKL